MFCHRTAECAAYEDDEMRGTDEGTYADSAVNYCAKCGELLDERWNIFGDSLVVCNQMGCWKSNRLSNNPGVCSFQIAVL